MKKYLAFLSLILFISCKNSTDPGTQNQNVIMPLAFANEWIYSRNDISIDGNSLTSIDTIKITDTATYSGEKYFALASGVWFVNRSSGLWRALGSPDLGILVKYPGVQGEIYKHDTLIVTQEISPNPLGKSIASWVIASTSEVVTVPSGTYLCYKYNADYYDVKTNQLNLRLNFYYAPNIGRIKDETFSIDSATQTLKLREASELIKVTLH